MFLETVGSFQRFLPRLTSRLMRGGRAAMAPVLRHVLAALLALPLSSALTRPDGRATGQRGRGKGTRVEAMLRPSWALFLGQVGAMLGEVGVTWGICQGDVEAACSQKRDARKHCKIPGWQGSAHSIVPCLGTCWGHVGPAWTMLGPCCGGESQGSKAGAAWPGPRPMAGFSANYILKIKSRSVHYGIYFLASQQEDVDFEEP